MIEISVIIPVYNGEEYIVRCLDSLIINKNYNKIIEIIIINDGSNDNTDNIIKNYIKEHNDIKFKYIINERNLGLSKSRHVGMKHIQGKYVHFVDVDDEIDSGVFYEMYQHLEEYNEDYCICKNIRFDSDGEEYYKSIDYEKFINLPTKIINGNIYNYPNLLLNGVCWIYLIKTDLIKKYNLSFGNGLYEDLNFTYSLHYYAKSFGFINKVGYYYFKNLKGICNSANIKDTNYLIFNQLVPIIDNKKFSKEYRNYISYGMFKLLPYDYLKYDINIKYFKQIFIKLYKYMNKDIFNRLDYIYQNFYLAIINEDEEIFNNMKKIINY